MAGKTAVVLLNMGGPQSIVAVHPFLKQLFSDRDIIPLPFQSILAPWIAKRRTPKIQNQYRQIGGKSPIFHWTHRQALLLQGLLDKSLPEQGPFSLFVAFRYTPPFTKDVIQDMEKKGIQRAVLLSLYPQYSCSTTGSSLNEFYRNAIASSNSFCIHVLKQTLNLV